MKDRILLILCLCGLILAVVVLIASRGKLNRLQVEQEVIKSQLLTHTSDLTDREKLNRLKAEQEAIKDQILTHTIQLAELKGIVAGLGGRGSKPAGLEGVLVAAADGVIGKWNATGPYKTPRFRAGSRWTVNWLCAPTEPTSFKLAVIDAETNEAVEAITNTEPGRRGRLLMYQAGEFYLDISSEGSEWTVSAVDRIK